MLVFHGLYGPHANEKSGTSVWNRIHELNTAGIAVAMVAPEITGERIEDRKRHQAFHGQHMLPLWESPAWRKIALKLTEKIGTEDMRRLIKKALGALHGQLPSDPLARMQTIHMLGVDLAASRFGLPSVGIEYATKRELEKIGRLEAAAKKSEERYKTASDGREALEWFRRYVDDQAAYNLARADVAANNVERMDQKLPDGSHVLTPYGPVHLGNLKYIQKRLRRRGVVIQIGSEVERPNATTLLHEMWQKTYQNPRFTPTRAELARALVHEMLTNLEMQRRVDEWLAGRKASPQNILNAQVEVAAEPKFIKFVRDNKKQLNRADPQKVLRFIERAYEGH